MAEIRPEIMESVLAVVRVGAGRKCAAQQAGITRNTLRDWERRGEAALAKAEAGEKLDKREEYFATFARRMAEADSHTKAYMLDVIGRAADDEWRAGAWLLEKLYPDDYGQRQRIDMATVPPEQQAERAREVVLALVERIAEAEGAAAANALLDEARVRALPDGE